MCTEKITIHSMTTKHGVEVQYARILRDCGRTIIGQSVLLHRLSQDQLSRAIMVSETAPTLSNHVI